MGVSEHGRPRWHPLGMAPFLVVIGLAAVGAGLASLGDSRPDDLPAPARADDELRAIRARILADVVRLMEVREGSGAPKVPNGAVVVPIRNGVPQAPVIDAPKPPRGAQLALLGGGLVVLAGLIYLLSPPPRPHAGKGSRNAS